MRKRKKLSDIINKGDERDSLGRTWDQTQPAGEHTPLPSGEYYCRVASGGLFQSSRKGTPGYKVVFEVAEGEYSGRPIYCDLWLTEPAMPMTKRDLKKLGLNRLEALDAPLPRVLLAVVQVALRRDDDGVTYNRVRGFEVVGVEPDDPFAPVGEGDPRPPAPPPLAADAAPGPSSPAGDTAVALEPEK